MEFWEYKMRWKKELNFHYYLILMMNVFLTYKLVKAMNLYFIHIVFKWLIPRVIYIVIRPSRHTDALDI